MTGFFKAIIPYLIAVTLVGLVIFGIQNHLASIKKVAYDTGYAAGADQVQQAYDAYKLEQATLAAALAEQNGKAQDKLNRDFEMKIGALNDKNADISAKLSAANQRLRDRKDRPTGIAHSAGAAIVPKTSENTAGPISCTGAELYRADGEFLIREAARADRIREALSTCLSS